MQIETKIQKLVTQSLENIQVDLPADFSVFVEYPADQSHGDYATNTALILFKKVAGTGAKSTYASPRELAEAIATELRKLTDSDSETVFQNISVAGPGFINFTLSESLLLSKMGNLVKNGVELSDSEYTGKKVILEFTDPNPFKELHIGHLYSNTVGESLSRMYEALGAQVQRVCYQGDVGMHVAKSVWGMRKLLQEKYPEQPIQSALTEIESETLQAKVKLLGQSYAAGAQAYSEQESAQKEMRDLNYLVFIAAQEALSGEYESTQKVVDYSQYVSGELLESQLYEMVKLLYVAGRTWSLQYFDMMYEKMGMQFDDYYFESQVGEIGFGIVQKFLKQGVFEESDGAVIFPGSKYGLHDRVFINSLGLPTYEAKELGLAPEKYRRFKYDLSLIITGNEIDEYFKVLLKALSFTNPDLAEKTTHLSHGMVRLPEGKMSSRTGKIITAEWLLSQAATRILEYMNQERDDIDQTYRKEAAEKIGAGAIKYAFLKQSIGKDISFSFDESLSFAGNSGPYIQYSYVRCQSILTKAQNGGFRADDESYVAKYIDTLLNRKSQNEGTISDDEINILRNLYKYSDIVSNAVKTVSPHVVATHLYELSQLLNGWYAKEKILFLENDVITSQSQRKLILVHAVALVLESGMGLLGMDTVEQM